MKKISRLLLLSIFIASCGNAVTPIPNVTVTRFAEVTVTYTPVPTSTATEIPPTPTETPDPNRPPDATDTDTAGNYTKPWLGADGKQVVSESGKPLNLTWVSIPTGPNGEMFNAWTEPHIKNPTYMGGIPSYDEPGFGLEPGMRMDFKVKEGLNAPYLQHVTNENFKGGLTYSVNFLDTMASRHFGMPYGQIKISQVGEFNRNIFLAGKLAEPVWDAQGNPHTIFSDTSFTLILVDPADIPNPDFTRPSRKGDSSSILSMTLFDDANHSVIILVSTTQPIDQLEEQDILDVILLPYGHILMFTDLSKEAWRADPAGASNAWSFPTMALKGDPPYFTLSDSP